MTFEDASKRFMDVFGEPGSIVQPVGGWEDLLGLGMPLSVFERMVTGMERSAGGFPYKAYP